MSMEENKTKALVLYRKGKTAEEVSEELELPKMIIDKWFDDAPRNDKVQLSANIHAIQTLVEDVNGELVPETMSPERALSIKVDTIAMDIANKLELAVIQDDMEYAKYLCVCTKTLTDLKSMLPKDTKVEEPVNPNKEHIEMFQELMRP